MPESNPTVGAWRNWRKNGYPSRSPRFDYTTLPVSPSTSKGIIRAHPRHPFHPCSISDSCGKEVPCQYNFTQKKSLWHSQECQRLCSGDGGNRTRVRRISPVDFYMLSSLVESRRLGPNEQSPLAASLVMSRPLQPGTAADQPPIPSSYPTMVALVSRTWLRLIRQPWHMHNHLHLLFCPAILRGARQPRHAVYDTLSSVETMSSPTSTYTYADTRTPVPGKHRNKI